jgi:hypothetical protein
VAHSARRAVAIRQAQTPMVTRLVYNIP